MKKLFVGAMAALFCVAFTLPAFAEVKVEGMIQADAYWFKKSKERIIGGLRDGAAATTQDDWSTTRMALPQPSNRISVRYTGEDKVVNGFIQIRTGGSRGNQNLVANNLNAGVASESAFSWEYAWIDWHVNPSLYFRFGRQDQVFQNAYATTAQGLGWNDNHIIGLGFGNFSAQSRDGIRAFVKFTDNVRMEVAAYDPNTETSSLFATAGTEFAALPSTRPGGVAVEANVIPRFDISLPIKIANFTIEPGFTWLKQQWDQVAIGDDSYDIWGVGLGMSAAFGPFSLMGEITYGQNLGSGQYIGAANAIQTAPVAGGNTAAPTYIAALNRFEDTDNLMAFLQGTFNFGPFAIQGVVGFCKGKNDGNPNIAQAVDAQEWDVTTWMYGMAFPIYVTKTFTITPSVFYYNFDKSATIGSVAAVNGSFANDVDLGYEVIAGVNFNLAF